MKYFVFYKGKTPIISIPVDAGLKVSFAGIGCLPSHTMIRKVFKIYMYFRIIIFYIFPFGGQNINGLLDQWLENITFTSIKVFPVFIWSLVDGRERYYVHVLDKKGAKKYFSKITLKRDDYHLLENERNSLLSFSSANTFNVPRVIDFTQNNLYCSLTTSYIDAGYFLNHPENNKFPSAIVDEISGHVAKVSLNKVLKKYDFKKDNDFNKFINNLDKNISVSVARSHGDFGSENIFKNNRGDYLIIDWERSDKLAPYLTDKVAYWLGKHHRLINNDSNMAYKNFRHSFEKYKKIDVVLSLHFLRSVRFDLAERLVYKWKN